MVLDPSQDDEEMHPQDTLRVSQVLTLKTPRNYKNLLETKEFF